MVLEVSVDDPRESGDRLVQVVSATVRDPDYEFLQCVFDYYAIWHAKKLPLGALRIEPRPDTPVRRTSVLTVSGVRDLPLARWETSARAHVAQYLTEQQWWNPDPAEVALVGKMMGMEPEDITGLQSAVAPAALVRRLHPGLSESTKPTDVRRYRGLLHLAEVAQEFRSAQMEGVPDPAVSVAKARDVNPATVRSWIHRARKARLLEPAQDQKES
jgi:hypothetical protein